MKRSCIQTKDPREIFTQEFEALVKKHGYSGASYLAWRDAKADAIDIGGYGETESDMGIVNEVMQRVRDWPEVKP